MKKGKNYNVRISMATIIHFHSFVLMISSIIVIPTTVIIPFCITARREMRSSNQLTLGMYAGATLLDIFTPYQHYTVVTVCFIMSNLLRYLAVSALCNILT